MTMLRQSTNVNTIIRTILHSTKQKIKICFNINQPFWKTFHRIVFWSMLVYIIYVLCYLPGTEKNLEFLGPTSEK